jgi:hypothetical protein
MKQPSANETLNKLLKNFFVELTHSGISNYKFKNYYYVINLNYNSAEKLLLRYQYGSTSSENSNESYKKLADNKAMLSPYTFWDIKIKQIKTGNNILNEIAKIALENDEIIVYLCGKGSFISKDLKSTNSSMVCDRKKRNAGNLRRESCMAKDHYKNFRKN